MRIGIDASRANKTERTGVEWYSYHLIEQFKKMDQENHYFLYTNKPLQGDLAQCPSNFEEVVLKWPIPRSWTLGRLSLAMKFGKKKPDVLFVPAHTIPLLNPKKSVVTVHDIGFEHFPDAYRWADRFYHKFVIHFIKRFASKILTVSNFSKQDLVRTYQIPKEKIRVVYNGYDQANYKVLDVPSSFIEKYQLNFPYFLFIGRLEKKKNVARLVEAFAQFKKKHPESKHKLILIGRKGAGFEKVEEQIKKYQAQKSTPIVHSMGVGEAEKSEEKSTPIVHSMGVDKQQTQRFHASHHESALMPVPSTVAELHSMGEGKASIEKDIIMPGWVEDEELPYFLNKAELFVFPSLFEGFGIPVIEAMSCGCPVICSNTTSLPEVAGEAALMFNPEKVEEIASRMEQVALNPEVQESLQEKGLRRAQEFSWQKCAEETLKELL